MRRIFNKCFTQQTKLSTMCDALGSFMKAIYQTGQRNPQKRHNTSRQSELGYAVLAGAVVDGRRTVPHRTGHYHQHEDDEETAAVR